MAECLNEELRSHIIDRGLTPLLGLSEGLAALQAAVESSGHDAIPSHAAVSEPASTRLVDEAEAKQRLAAFGVAVPDWHRRVLRPMSIRCCGARSASRSR